MTGELIYKTLQDIAPEAFSAARKRAKREEQEYSEIIGLRRGRIKKRLVALGLDEVNDFDHYMEQEQRLIKEMEIDTLYTACKQAEDAYFDLVRPIKEWKCHSLVLIGRTRSLYEQKEVTLEDVNAMLPGVEDYETGQVTLEDGRVFRMMQDDEGYYCGGDGSVISALDLVRTDKDGVPVKVEARLGYVAVGKAGAYESMPY